MPFERLDDLEQAGAALALTGGLIAVVPQAQLLLHGPPGWTAALALTLLSMAVVCAVALAISSKRILGGALAVLAGAPLVFFGATTGGVLALIGGALIVLGGSKDPARASASGGREGSVEP